MNALSMELRERIVAAYCAGEGSHRELAERFAVSNAVEAVESVGGAVNVLRLTHRI